MRRRRTWLVAGLLSVLAMAWASPPASAHALLTASSPADGASIDESPVEVVLTFTEAVDPALSIVRLFDASGRQVDSGTAGSIDGQPAQVRLPLGAPGSLTEGGYTATWRVTSPADGHTTVGSVAFGVGVPAVAAGTDRAEAGVRSPAPSAAGVLGRWLFYAGVVALLGAAVVGVAVVSDPAAVSGPALLAAWAAAATGVAITAADQRASAQASLATLLSSSTGHRLAVQAVAVAVAGAAAVWALRRPRRTSLAAVGLAAAGAMLARALAGHANASSPRWFTVGVQWAHLVAVGAWIGGLLWFLLALRRGDPGRGPGLVRRFSAVAAAMLGVVLVSGTLRALDDVGAWSRLVDTSFGITLIAKVAMVAAVVGLGARNRFRHVPAASVAGGPVGGLRRLVRAEVAIAAGVLGATALLTGFPPSAVVAAARREATVPGVTVTGNDYATSVRIRLNVSPGSPGPNRFDMILRDYDSGAAVAAHSVSLRFRLADRPDVSAATLDLTREGDGHWQGTGSALSIEGRWSVVALVQTASDAVEVPMEVLTPRNGSTDASQPGSPVGGCGGGEFDASYTVTSDSDPDPPAAEATTFRLTIRHDGRAVTGARVCLRSAMPDMTHPGISTVATEASGGRYDARLKFGMTGGWVGSVVVTEPGGRTVTMPIRFEVG